MMKKINEHEKISEPFFSRFANLYNLQRCNLNEIKDSCIKFIPNLYL